MPKQRLDKIIASTGRYSRREVKRLVHEGRVLVDGRAAESAEEKYDPLRAAITVNGEAIGYREHTYVMLHKPAGVLSATEDGRGKTVLDLLPPEYRKIGLFPAGSIRTRRACCCSPTTAHWRTICSPRKNTLIKSTLRVWTAYSRRRTARPSPPA